MIMNVIRGVHGSGGKKSDPEPTTGVIRLSRLWVRVEIGSIQSVSSRHQSYKIITGSAKSSPKSAKLSSENAKTHQICIKIAKIYTKIAEIYWEWPDLAKSHQIQLRTCWISSNLSLISSDLYITSIGSGGSGFREENSPLDSPTLGLGHGNLKPTNGSIGLS